MESQYYGPIWGVDPRWIRVDPVVWVQQGNHAITMLRWKFGRGIRVGSGWIRLCGCNKEITQSLLPGGPTVLWKTLEDVWKTNFSPILLWKTLILLKGLI